MGINSMKNTSNLDYNPEFKIYLTNEIIEI